MRLARYAPVVVGVALATAGLAQESQPAVNSTATLNLPENPQLFGTTLPSVVKATAIVNGEVITQSDIDQRVALLALGNGGQIPANELDPLRRQVLRNLIDETLQIQAAKAEEIEISDAVAANFRRKIIAFARDVLECFAQNGFGNGRAHRVTFSPRC